MDNFRAGIHTMNGYVGVESEDRGIVLDVCVYDLNMIDSETGEIVFTDEQAKALADLFGFIVSLRKGFIDVST